MEVQDETLFDTIRKTIPPLHPEGWKFVAIFALGTLLICKIITPLFFWPGVILTVWCAYFFRDPIRTVPTRAGLLVSPADGLVQKIVKVVPPQALQLGEAPRTRISIFLNVFDVHVNRMPSQASSRRCTIIPGKFFNASLDKASDENERQHITVTLPSGIRPSAWCRSQGSWRGAFSVRSKRARPWRPASGQGLIRFGSRVDIYLPEGADTARHRGPARRWR